MKPMRNKRFFSNRKNPLAAPINRASHAPALATRADTRPTPKWSDPTTKQGRRANRQVERIAKAQDRRAYKRDKMQRQMEYKTKNAAWTNAKEMVLGLGGELAGSVAPSASAAATGAIVQNINGGTTSTRANNSDESKDSSPWRDEPLAKRSARGRDEE